MPPSIGTSALAAFLRPSETDTGHATADAASLARARLDAMVRDGDVPGAQYVVVTKDAVLVRAAAGVRDVSTRLPMEHDTLQMAYSTTKAITAVAVMQLVEAGRMALDQPLDDFCAHPYGGAVTIRSLLAQTSGVPSPMPLDWFEVEGQPFDRDAKLREVLAAHPRLVHAPGARYRYSNVAYWLLEKAIEAASGEPYERTVRARVLEPLAIAPRAALFSLGTAGETATGHARRYGPTSLVLSWMTPSRYWEDAHGAWRRVARLQPHGVGYGGLFASASALAAILQDLLRDEPILMSRESRSTMLTPQRTTAGKPLDMTLGWVTGRLAGARYFGKQGGGLGFHGNLRIYPDHGFATAMLANRTEISARPIDARSDRLDAILVRGAEGSRV